MQFSKQTIDIKFIIQQLCSSLEFQSKLEQKFNNFLNKGQQLNHQVSIHNSSHKQSDKLISEISFVIDTLIKTNLRQSLQNEFKGFKDEIAKLKQEFKNQLTNLDIVKRKVQKEPLSFGQAYNQQTQGEDQYRNRFQIMRKPANLVVSGGTGITTYTTSPTFQNSKVQDHPKNEIEKLKEEIETIRKQITNQPLTLPSQLKQINNRIQRNNQKIKTQLDTMVKNNDTRFQYTEQSIKKHMERSLQSLWKIITSIKGQIEQVSSQLHLNQSGIMMSDL